MSQPSSRSAVGTILPTGLMLFALFFGAGNLIFPPLLGAASGRSFILVMAGFLATGVLMPLITVVAVSTSGEGILGLARRVGPDSVWSCRWRSTWRSARSTPSPA